MHILEDFLAFMTIGVDWADRHGVGFAKNFHVTLETISWSANSRAEGAWKASILRHGRVNNCSWIVFIWLTRPAFDSRARSHTSQIHKSPQLAGSISCFLHALLTFARSALVASNSSVRFKNHYPPLVTITDSQSSKETPKYANLSRNRFLDCAGVCCQKEAQNLEPSSEQDDKSNTSGA